LRFVERQSFGKLNRTGRQQEAVRVFTRTASCICEQNYKPGSVFDSHLSRRAVANTLKPPRERPGRPYAPIPVLLRIEFTAAVCSQPSGELLPRLSTLTAAASRGGGISLLHFS